MFLKTQPPPLPIKKLEIHTLCQRLGISSVCWDLQTRSAKRRIPCNLTSLILTLDFVSSWATCMTILKLDAGHSFFFYFRSLPHFDWFALDQSDRRSQSVADIPWLVGDWLPSTCIQDTETSQGEGSPLFSACLKKGAVNNLSREALGLDFPKTFIPLLGGPLYPHVDVVNMGFRLLNYGAVDLTVVAV